MRRREFIKLGSSAAVFWPLAVNAQQAGKLPTIGWLGGNASLESPWVDGLVRRLGELGWVEGHTVTIERRWSENRSERIVAIATDYVKRTFDVIVTYGAAAAITKNITASIPIVFAVAADPVGTGLVRSLSYPGGNVTGLSLQQAESAGKRIGLLRDIVPNLHHLAILFDASYRGSLKELDNVQISARDLGLEVAPHGVQRADEIEPVLVDLKGKADAVYVIDNSLLANASSRIGVLALDFRLPMIFTTMEAARAGALVSYGPNIADLYRRAADYVDKILRGANPGDLPIEQPTKFDLVINLKTAKALRLTVPHNLLVLADEVIE